LNEVLITRVVQARPWKVFKAWTNEMLIAQWWGPAGFENPVCKLDVTRGGEIYIEMKAPDGTVYPIKGNFKEIEEPEQLVFTVTAFPGQDGIPGLKILNTVIFIGEQYNTRLTLQAVVMKSTPDAIPAMKNMEARWNESLDKLERLLLQLKFNCFTINKTKNDDD